MTNDTAKKPIPFLDLVTPHAELRKELCDVFEVALSSAAFIGGAAVQGFEKEFAEFCEVAHCAGVSSGTDALRFALMASGVRDGDIVLTVPNTFIATTEAISQAGGLPVFIDVDKVTYNLDGTKLREYLEIECDFDPVARLLVDRNRRRRVAAIVPVHLYGQMADMDTILELAARYDLKVIEDACQAHGAQYFSRRENRWCKAGSMGQAAAFSFYPGKNLGACGEGGAVTTNDPDIARKVRMLRDHGQTRKYYHEVEGYNGRLDSIQAGILRVKLQHLTEWNQQRIESARVYDQKFAEAGMDVATPYVPDWARPVYHLYVVRVQDRESMQQHLSAAGIGTGIHYPFPLHLIPPYQALGYKKGDLPVAEAAAAEILSLPMFPGLLVEDQTRVVAEMLQRASAARATVA